MDKHDTLLLSCGTPENRRYLRSVLEQRYNLLEAINAQQTMLLLNQNFGCIAAVVLDISDPEKIDIDVLRKQETIGLLEKLPVIAISPDDSPDVLNKCFDYGAADVIPRDYDPYAMLHRIESIVDLHLHKQYLEAMVEEQADILRHSNEIMVDALSSLIEYRSVESGQHVLRIRHFTKILLEEVASCCPEYQLTDQVIAIISSASALHDIGKIAISDSILMKPGPLTPEEREVMKTHTITGSHILDTLRDVTDQDYLRYAHNICHYHHERWDGRGYPEGLAGDEIPICAQVVGLADVYDALTSPRVYKEAYTFAKAANMILKGECGAFSPKLLECFKHVTDQFEALAQAYADGMSPKSESFDVTLPAPVDRKDDSMERTWAKYQALVHYINVFLMEVDLNQGLFHVIYNPYPDFARFQEMNTLDDMGRMILDELVVPEERGRVERFLHQDIDDFIEEDLRRVSYHFHMRDRYSPEGQCFEVTLLRVNPIDASRRTFAVLCRRAEERAAASEAITPVLLDSTFCCRNDEDFTLIQLGKQVQRLAGYSPEELETLFGNRLIGLVVPEDRDMIRKEFREQLSRGTSVELEFRVRRKDGKVLWVLDRSRLHVGQDGREYIYNFLTDISRTKQVCYELKERVQRYEIILSQTENVLFEWDCNTDTISFSDTWQGIFGFPPLTSNVRRALTGGAFFHPDDLPLLIDHLGNLENGSNYEVAEVRIATAGGRYLWCRFRATAIRNQLGNLDKVAGVIINIDAEKQAERLLQDRAERDSLTKLLNKHAARKQAEEYLSRFPKGVRCAMLIIDLDNFKQVNDQHGHLFGDVVLTKAAREIGKLFRNQDIVGRIGGDEFLVLMRGVSDRNLVESRCQRLLNIFYSTFHSQQYHLPLTCSIGISLSPEHGTSYYELFNRADQALYRAKAKGKNNFVFYDGCDDLFPTQQIRETAVNNRIDSDEEPGMADDNIVRYVLQRLYTSKDTEASIRDILKLIGQKMNVSRAYIFENSEDNRFCSNTYEWCNDGIESVIDRLRHVSYETDIPDYESNFNEQGIFYCPDISDLPEPTYDIANSQNVKSMLHCSIRDNGIFRGFIGFDECKEQRMWTKEEIRVLSYLSDMLSLFLLKYREQEKAVMQAEEFRSILDNQNAWIYIVDPDTCGLRYLNARTRSLAPNAKHGMCCYKALMGREERCPGCPAVNIREKKTNTALLQDGKFPLEILAEATLIQWNGEESCLMTCRKMPKSGQ